MAKLSNITRINASDYSEEIRGDISKLAGELNYFMQDVVDAFDKNINFDNINMETLDIKISTNSSGIPLSTIVINTSDSKLILGIHVIRYTNNTNLANYATSAPFVSYTEQNNGYKISHVTGLRAGENYTLKLLIITA